MGALEAIRAELARIEAKPESERTLAHCEAQLAQVRQRIAGALEDRKRTTRSADWQLLNRRLHTLYALEHDIKQDMANARH